MLRGVVLWLALAAAGIAAEAPKEQPAGTRRMAERLTEIRQEAGPILNPFANAARIELVRQQVVEAQTPPARIEARLVLGRELLQAGRNAEAAQEYEQAEQEGSAGRYRFDHRSLAHVRMQQAISYLRLGEQQNCQSNHNADRCLLPIRDGGVHRLREGSEKARSLLLEQLRFYPRDLSARWLLNIAAMTLGEYPGNVPEQLLIPPAVFASDYPLPRYPDVAEDVGLRLDDLAGGSITEDFDGDGWLDVLLSSWDWDGQLRYFHNAGNGRFVERTQEAALLGVVGGLNLVQADYNNDGSPDVFIPRGAWLGKAGRHPNSLLKNNGDGTFADVTEEAGMLSFHPTQTAAWFDFDQDGWLDLFIGNETSGGALVGNATNVAEVHVCELYRNNRNGTFTECAAQAGLAVRAFVKGVVAEDYNNDGRMDLYLSVLGQPNLLFRNDGPAPAEKQPGRIWQFTEVGAAAGVTEPLLSFPTWFFDYDNDGWPDIFVAGYTTNFTLATLSGIVSNILGQPTGVEKARLFRNNRDGTFSNVTAAARLDRVLYAMGANFGDLDNDGWLDFYIGTGDPNLGTLVPNLMFRNAGGSFFQDVTTAGGFGHLQKGHGISFADLNNDGHQDVVANLGGAYTGDNYRKSLFANPGNSNRWLTLRLEGVRANRSAIGARIKVVVQTGHGERAIYKSVNTGGSFGASPLRQEIGLGQALAIKSVEIRWPAPGGAQTLRGLALDRFYTVREGEPQARGWKLALFKWPPPGQVRHVHEHK